MRLRRIGILAVEYVAAVVLAGAALALRIARTSDADAEASSGMHAFGDALLFVAVFGVAALVPTGVALVWLRPYRRVWTALAIVGLGVAVTGLAAAVVFAAGRHAVAPSPLATWAPPAVLRILVAPLLALGSLVCTILAPSRFPRLAFLATTAAETAVSGYGGLVWVVPLFLR